MVLLALVEHTCKKLVMAHLQTLRPSFLSLQVCPLLPLPCPSLPASSPLTHWEPYPLKIWRKVVSDVKPVFLHLSIICFFELPLRIPTISAEAVKSVSRCCTQSSYCGPFHFLNPLKTFALKLQIYIWTVVIFAAYLRIPDIFCIFFKSLNTYGKINICKFPEIWMFSLFPISYAYFTLEVVEKVKSA